MNLTAVAIAAIVVAGVLAFLFFIQRSQAAQLERSKALNKQLWEKMLSGQKLRDDAKGAEIDKVAAEPAEQRYTDTLERTKKWPQD